MTMEMNPEPKPLDQEGALRSLSDRNAELEEELTAVKAELTEAQENLERREEELLRNIADQTRELEMLRTVGDGHEAVAAQRDRLWRGLFTWQKNHARGCTLAQGGGFCVECSWVQKLIKAESGTPVAQKVEEL